MKRLSAQSLASWVGTAFLVVGILGFIPGITSHYDRLKFAGHRSGAELLGVFDVSILHNLIHLALGVAGLWLARTLAGARLYLFGGGSACLILWVYGLIIDRGDSANFIPVDDADNWLHFSLGLAMIVGGLATAGLRSGQPAPAA